MKEPPKDANATIVCIIVAVIFLLIAGAFANSAPSAFSDPLGRVTFFYVAGAFVGSAFFMVILGMLFYQLHRMTLINFAILTTIKDAEASRRAQMDPVEKVASSLAAKHGL